MIALKTIHQIDKNKRDLPIMTENNVADLSDPKDLDDINNLDDWEGISDSDDDDPLVSGTLTLYDPRD
jgi:hypothetical protein